MDLTPDFVKIIKTHAAGLLSEEVTGKKLRGLTVQHQLKQANNHLEEKFCDTILALRPHITYAFRQSCMIRRNENSEWFGKSALPLPPHYEVYITSRRF